MNADMFFETKEPKSSGMPAGASPTPLPVRFLKLRADTRLKYSKNVAIAEAANYAAVLIKTKKHKETE